MRASVLITTKDRKNDLRRAIASAIRQTEPVEIIVLDDGSSDGTSEMVKSEFPQVRLDQTPISLGLVTQRNRGTLLCSGEIVFSIDDDAEFSTPYVVAQTLAGFCHPRVAAIAIPYMEPQKPGQEIRKAPTADAIWVTESFRGTSYALKRQVFLELGGYREQIIHQGEEMDFCIRLLDNGFVVRLGSSDLIIHHEMPKREWRRMDFYGRKNDILFAWRNVPMPYLPLHLIATTCNGITCAVRAKHPADMLRGMLSAYTEILSNWRCHEPVSPRTYHLHRLLKKRGARMLSDIEPLLPALGIGPAVSGEESAFIKESL
jgi:glycosyltransferase involved in cell wall biosynthesis